MMKTLHEIRPIKRVEESKLLKLSGVTGIDVGYKYVKGKKTDELAIRVYVEEKKAEKDVPKDEVIPKTIEGVKTDVIQRKFVLHPLRVRLDEIEVKADTGRYDPLKGGISIGPCRTVGGYIYVGTLGAIVRDNATNDPMLLSNFHVMCVDDQWSAGDDMCQPSRPDGGHCPADIVGQLQRASLGGQVDCAVASHAARGYACEIVDIGSVTGTATANVGLAVRKRGRTTGLTYGTVDTVDLTVSIDYEDGLGIVTLTDQIGIEVDPERSVRFGDNGDSGSVVVNDQRRVVGLYFAGTDSGDYGVANPIQAVLSALNISMCVPPVKKMEPDKIWWWEHEYWKDLIERLKELEKGKEWGKEFEKWKPRGEIPPESAPAATRGTIEERVACLESTVGQLTHFIRSEFRPDLSKSPLRNEPDTD